MKFLIRFTNVKFNSKGEIISSTAKTLTNVPVKTKNEAIEFYKRFKKRSIDFLTITSQHNKSKTVFGGLYKLTKKGEVLIS